MVPESLDKVFTKRCKALKFGKKEMLKKLRISTATYYGKKVKLGCISKLCNFCGLNLSDIRELDNVAYQGGERFKGTLDLFRLAPSLNAFFGVMRAFVDTSKSLSSDLSYKEYKEFATINMGKEWNICFKYMDNSIYYMMVGTSYTNLSNISNESWVEVDNELFGKIWSTIDKNGI